MQEDDRLHWPHRFFDWGCRCEGNFWGPFCLHCRYGWKGPNCDQKVVRVRKNAMKLTPEERAEFRRVITTSKKTMSPLHILKNVYDQDPLVNPDFVSATIHTLFVYQHATASRHSITTKNGEPMYCDSPEHPYDFAHFGPGFLPWHRTFLLIWELFIQLMVPGAEDFVFPYWDWTGDGDDCEVCINDLVGATNFSDPDGRLDKASPFYEWEMLCQYEDQMHGCRICNLNRSGGPLIRIPGANPTIPQLPTQREEDWTMSRPFFWVDPKDSERIHLSFAAALEGTVNEQGERKQTMHQAVGLIQADCINELLNWIGK